MMMRIAGSLSASAYSTRILLVTEMKRKLTLVRTGEDDKAKSTILYFKGRGEKPTKREKRLNFFGRVMTAREGNIYCLLGSTHPARVKLQDTFSFSLSLPAKHQPSPSFPHSDLESGRKITQKFFPWNFRTSRAFFSNRFVTIFTLWKTMRIKRTLGATASPAPRSAPPFRD